MKNSLKNFKPIETNTSTITSTNRTGKIKTNVNYMLDVLPPISNFVLNQMKHI